MEFALGLDPNVQNRDFVDVSRFDEDEMEFSVDFENPTNEEICWEFSEDGSFWDLIPESWFTTPQQNPSPPSMIGVRRIRAPIRDQFMFRFAYQRPPP